MARVVPCGGKAVEKPKATFLRRAHPRSADEPAGKAGGKPRVSKSALSAREPTLRTMNLPRNQPVGRCVPSVAYRGRQAVPEAFSTDRLRAGGSGTIRPSFSARPPADTSGPRGTSEGVAQRLQVCGADGPSCREGWICAGASLVPTAVSRWECAPEPGATDPYRRAKARATLRSRWMGPRGLAFRATHRRNVSGRSRTRNPARR